MKDMYVLQIDGKYIQEWFEYGEILDDVAGTDSADAHRFETEDEARACMENAIERIYDMGPHPEMVISQIRLVPVVRVPANTSPCPFCPLDEKLFTRRGRE